MCFMTINDNNDLIVLVKGREIIIQNITEEDRYNALIAQGITSLVAEGIVKGLWYTNMLVSSNGRKRV